MRMFFGWRYTEILSHWNGSVVDISAYTPVFNNNSSYNISLVVVFVFLGWRVGGGVCSLGGGGGSLSFLHKCCQAHQFGATEIHFVFQCPVYDQETSLNVAKVLVCASKVIQDEC